MPNLNFFAIICYGWFYLVVLFLSEWYIIYVGESMTNEKKLAEIQEFLLSIKNMLESKYILIDRRVSDILRAIADTNAVYNLIAECMINFDFAYEWRKATAGSFLKLPDSEAKKVAFIFCLLNNIDDRKIDVTQVLEKYYSYDLAYSPYDMFCKFVIVEFRRIILKFLNIEIPKPRPTVEFTAPEIESNEQKPEIDDFEKLDIVLRDFVKFLGEQKKLKNSFMPKYDLIAVASTFEQVVRNKQVEYFYAFLVTLNSAAPKNKEVRAMLAEINKLASLLISRRK